MAVELKIYRQAYKSIVVSSQKGLIKKSENEEVDSDGDDGTGGET